MPRAYTDEPNANAAVRVHPTCRTAPTAPDAAAVKAAASHRALPGSPTESAPWLSTPRASRRVPRTRAEAAAAAFSRPAATNAARVPRNGRRTNDPVSAPSAAPTVLRP